MIGRQNGRRQARPLHCPRVGRKPPGAAVSFANSTRRYCIMKDPRFLASGLCFLIFSTVPAALLADDQFRFTEAKHGKGELRYINSLPVLTVEGTPEEMGEQLGTLGTVSALELQLYFKQLVKHQGLEAALPLLMRM